MHVRHALALSLALGVTSARADVLPSPPTDCLRGSVGRAEAAAGSWCEPTSCTTDAQCESGQTCSTEEIALCVYSEDRPTVRVRSGFPPPEHLPPVPTRSIRMARERGCEPDGTCLNLQSTCERARRCVTAAPAPAPAPIVEPEATPAAPPPTAAPTGTCGCRVASESGSLPAIGLVLVLFARRRRAT